MSIGYMRVNRYTIFANMVLLLVLGMLISPIQAQDVARDWEAPQRLNSVCCASFLMPVVDPWGQLHMFWADQDGFLLYVRLDEQGWSSPLEIIASQTGDAIRWPEVAVDRDGYLHLVWLEGLSGPLWYSRVWAFEADNIRAWQEPVMVAEKALHDSIGVDSSGLVHIVYSPFEDGRGIVHVTTRDGTSWSQPTIVSEELSFGWTGKFVSLAIDQQDSLYVFWNSAVFPDGSPVHALFYQRSTDGGRTWSLSYDPDPLPPEVDADSESYYKNALPSVAVGPTGDIHLTWHQHTGFRWHRWSDDGGVTWSEKQPLFPDMGPAYNGLVDMDFDSTGRMHVVATRSSVWYQSWERGSGWSVPELVDPSSQDWHHQRVKVYRGNRVYLFYADINDTGIIWYTSKVIGAPALTPEPRPARLVTPTDQPRELMTATATVQPVAISTSTPQISALFDPPGNNSGLFSQLPFLAGVLPAFLLIVIIAATKLSSSRKH